MAEPLNLQLQPASFRGVPFHVDGAEIEAGRRVQVHEYPQRDKPWAEDLGRATRGFMVDAFVVGPGYIEDAEALIAAAEEEGPGTLVHPWLGSMEVSLKELLRVRFNASAGHAVITFSFVEAGELEFPAAQSSTAMQSRIAADGLSTAACDSFASRFAVDGWASFVGDQALLDLASAFSALRALSSVSVLSGWANQFAEIGNLVQSLAYPLQLAQQLADLFDLSPTVAALPADSSFNTQDPMGAIVQAIVAVAGSGGAGRVLNAPVVAATASAARKQQVGNTAAINALVRSTMLAQAVGISSHVNATVQADVYAVRTALCAALDAESLLADDVGYQALQTARRAVWTDLTARASSGARLLPLIPLQVTSALVLAYDRYEDANRAQEIVTRNRLIHPGFVPMQTLQVLSK